MDKRIWIVVGILILVGLGFLLVSNMTGGVITGMSVSDEIIEADYLHVDSVGELNDEVNLDDTQNSGGSG
ncbi:MAG: hypothetical protein KJ592_03150 [Nanoarchaeota archaeon]|nr:hypothetical protein [Nanoarchaeota archaeon]